MVKVTCSIISNTHGKNKSIYTVSSLESIVEIQGCPLVACFLAFGTHSWRAKDVGWPAYYTDIVWV